MPSKIFFVDRFFSFQLGIIPPSSGLEVSAEKFIHSVIGGLLYVATPFFSTFEILFLSLNFHRL